MAREQVIFGLQDQRHEKLYDRSRLQLGAIVHVSFTLDGPEFSPEPSVDSVAHEVTWISPSEWWVPLSTGWVVPEKAIRNISRAVQGLMSDDEVRAALDLTRSDVPLGQQYRSDRIAGSRANQLSAAAERLDLAHRLLDPRCRDALFSHQEALVTYLLLTCFDLLGQPAQWKDFGSWLNSKAIGSTEFKSGSTPVQLTQVVYSTWLTEYGVKNAFYHFIDNVLPYTVKEAFLNSFELTILENPPTLSRLEVTEADKKKYLYKLRNQYTHRAQFFQGVIGALPIPPGATIAGREQTFTGTKWIDFATRDWPHPLEEAVRQGLAARLREILRAAA